MGRIPGGGCLVARGPENAGQCDAGDRKAGRKRDHGEPCGFRTVSSLRQAPRAIVQEMEPPMNADVRRFSPGLAIRWMLPALVVTLVAARSAFVLAADEPAVGDKPAF